MSTKPSTESWNTRQDTIVCSYKSQLKSLSGSSENDATTGVEGGVSTTGSTAGSTLGLSPTIGILGRFAIVIFLSCDTTYCRQRIAAGVCHRTAHRLRLIKQLRKGIPSADVLPALMEEHCD